MQKQRKIRDWNLNSFVPISPLPLRFNLNPGNSMSNHDPTNKKGRDQRQTGTPPHYTVTNSATSVTLTLSRIPVKAAILYVVSREGSHHHSLSSTFTQQTHDDYVAVIYDCIIAEECRFDWREIRCQELRDILRAHPVRSPYHLLIEMDLARLSINA